MAEILVVDDDSGMREFLEIMLTQEGYGVTCADGGKEALNLCSKRGFDLVITDLKMPKIDGIDFLRAVKDISPETMVILITVDSVMKLKGRIVVKSLRFLRMEVQRENAALSY